MTSRLLDYGQSLTRPLPPEDAEQFVDGNAVTLLTDTSVVFERMLGCIATAQRSVWLEMYWFASDTIGRRFFAELEAAAQRGVEVRVLVDALGSFSTEPVYFQRLRAAGALVVEFNPLNPFQRRTRVARLTTRNHRKLLLVDWSTAFVGGLNIAEAWLSLDEGGKGWRDDVVMLAGPVVRRLAASFCGSWREQCGEPLRFSDVPMPAVGSVRAAVLTQGRFSEKRQAIAAYLQRVASAQQEILIANAYFVPNRRLRRALRNAARRGVDVRIMVPARSDVELVRHASRAVWGGLLRQGARIYEWQPSMLHSKTAVIDRQWATVGSFNLDYISISNNRELNVSVLDADFAQAVASSFERDIGDCYEVDPYHFKFRSLGERLAERVLYWFRAWL